MGTLWFIFALMVCVALVFLLWPLLRYRAYKSAVAVLLAVPVISILLYQHWGSSDKLQQWFVMQQQEVLVKKRVAELHSPQELITGLKKRLAADPDSVQGWYLLGRLYTSLNDFDGASEAFAKAHQLAPENIDLMMHYAQSLFFQQQRHLNGKAEQLVKIVLQQDPNHTMALSLLAMNAYTKKDYTQAITYWQQLLVLSAPGSEDSKMIKQAIARAEQFRGQKTEDRR